MFSTGLHRIIDVQSKNNLNCVFVSIKINYIQQQLVSVSLELHQWLPL